jgi:hypothetical protein
VRNSKRPLDVRDPVIITAPSVIRDWLILFLIWSAFIEDLQLAGAAMIALLAAIYMLGPRQTTWIWTKD